MSEETKKPKQEQPEEETVKAPVKPDTGGPHDCPKGMFWDDQLGECVPDVGN